MNESKPTPGPWYVSQVGLTNGGERPITTEDGRICTVDCQTPFKRGEGWQSECEVREANARLIAAAPETAAERDRLKEVNAELLEVLRLIADQALRCEIPEGYGPEFRSEEWDAGYDAAISSARAAISKAKGGVA
jgi:hypothetical protein